MQGIRLFMAALALLVACGTGIALGADEGTGEESAAAAEALSAAPDPDPGVELTAKRTATSNTFRLSSGKLETQIFSSPVNYQDASGDWHPIDESLEAQPDGTGLTNGANSFDLSLPERIGQAPVRMSLGEGQWISTRLKDQPSAAPEVDGNEASYEAEPGTTFSLTSVPDGLKEDIEVSGPSEPHSFAFELEASAGLTPELAEDGSIRIEDEDEETVGVLPAPVMFDSTPGVPNVSHDIQYGLERQGDTNWLLSVEASDAWLARPDLQWPVHLDPSSLTDYVPYLDCTISGTAGSNGSGLCAQSGQKQLYARYKRVGSSDEWSRTLVNFQLTGEPPLVPSLLPAPSAKPYIFKATLYMNSPSAALNTSGVEARQITKSWKSGVNWRKTGQGYSSWANEGGDYSSEGAQILTSQRGSQAGWWTFDLTSLVQRWAYYEAFPQHDNEYGVLLKLLDEKAGCCSERSVAFDSSVIADSNNRPRFTVDYYVKLPGSEVASPTEGTKTARRLKLKAKWTTQGITGVSYQYREGSKGAFKPVPANLVKTAQGQEVAWPQAVSPGLKESEPLYFDALSAVQPSGGKIQIRAVLDGAGVSGYTGAVNATIDPYLGGARDATASVGPGSVDLLTGNFTVARTDVSIPVFSTALEFARSHSSRDPGHGGNTSVLGAGWQPTSPVEAAGGAEWRSVQIVNPSAEEAEEGMVPYALLTDLEGYEYAFESNGNGFDTPPEAAGFMLSWADESHAHLALSDPGGNRTLFENSSGGSEYLPVSVSQSGGANATTMVWKLVNGSRRLSMVIAPSSVECNESNATTTVGCRALTFNYQLARTWGAPDSYGERLAAITYYGPSSGSATSHWDVARYNYNPEGRLTQEWDPRITTPLLKETYSYNPIGTIQTITPTGEEAWTLEYLSSGGNPSGRLGAVKRPSLLSSPSVAQTTIAYGVPLSGSGVPDMSPTAVAQWGQADIPTDATAIFPPDEIPASPPSAYSRATIYYLDAEGQEVNTATPSGAGTSVPSVTTTERDEHGNVVRELSAQNRLRALEKGAGSVTRSHELETKRTFNVEGTEMLEELGPLHQVRLESSGKIVPARSHKVVFYDEGATQPPTGTPWPHLPTREVLSASIPSEGIDADQHVTVTQYDWNLRKPIDVTVDPGGLELHSHTSYDSRGMPTEMRQPANPSGGDAHTTKITYYTALGSDGCGGFGTAGYWGLPCRVEAAGKASSEGAPELLVKKFLAYSPLGAPTEISESPGGGSEGARKTLITYDAAGRETSFLQEGGGVSLPKRETTYSPVNGRPKAQLFACAPGCDSQETRVAYDTLGRITEYEDADGNVSGTTYDLLGRPVLSGDGKGTQARTYDPTSGLLVKLEDSGAGTFTAAYDADGNLVEEGLPNGLVAKTTYDEAGQATHLSYEKKAFCSTGCTWLDLGVERSVTGQILTQSSLTSSQQYEYDKAGRLKLARDTPQGGGCTTRSYSYDKDSNRTALITRVPGIGGACDTSSQGSEQTYKYDAADRLIGGGVTYDNFGRITSLPGAYAGGSTLTTSYFSNDLVATQSQGGITNSYQLDAAMRQRQRTQTGGKEPGTEVLHYADSSDSPAWTETSSGWTRNVVGIGGNLAAIQDSAKGTTLQLCNLHGDIIATASSSPEATKLLVSFEFDEFGNPKQEAGPKYGWLGGKQRRTELPSGVIQMGVRSYVPAIGRFLSRDPVKGGSASEYDYVEDDPMNDLDLEGTCPKRRCHSAKRQNPSKARQIRVAKGHNGPRVGAHLSATLDSGREKLGRVLPPQLPPEMQCHTRACHRRQRRRPKHPWDPDPCAIVNIYASPSPCDPGGIAESVTPSVPDLPILVP